MLATTTVWPRFSSRRLATSWLMRLSSTSKNAPGLARFAQGVARDQRRPIPFDRLGAQCQQDSAAQFRALDGLGEIGGDAQLAAADGVARWPAEVSITTVAPAMTGSFLIVSARVKPSVSGIWKSVSTRSKGFPDCLRHAQRGERLGHACRQRGNHAPADEHLFEHAPVRGVVVDDEDAQVAQIDRVGNRRAAAAVTNAKLAVKWKVLPVPTSLSTQMRPPISSTSCDEIVRPSPVPP